MIKKCARCGVEMGHTEVHGRGESLVSQSICSNCTENIISPNVGGTLKGLLDKFHMPILAVDSSVRIMTANKAALALLDKKLESIVDLMGGDAVECAYSKLPDGCGKTDHCKGCSMRMTLEETFFTGQPQERKTAIHSIQTADGVKKVRFIISTEKLQNILLLKIDSMKTYEN